MANTFKSVYLPNIGTGVTEIYTVPATPTIQSTIIGCSVANTSTVPCTVDVFFARNGITTFLIKGAPVPVGGSLVIVGGQEKIVMENNDSFRAQASNANSLDVIMSYLEIRANV